ncbi:hypothetical protein DIPPA_04156 [Diplonema papillatum]|nr:hypothetical protein DIPPA_04156 [Diplonema papillatum]
MRYSFVDGNVQAAIWISQWISLSDDKMTTTAVANANYIQMKSIARVLVDQVVDYGGPIVQ